MAITCTPESLVNAACCFVDMGWTTRQAIRILNWCALLNGDTMNCSPQELANAARCFQACLSASQLDAVETYLSCQIANNGGGGGGATQVFIDDYSGAEPGFTPTTSPVIAFDTSTGPPYDMWVWNGSSWA